MKRWRVYLLLEWKRAIQLLPALLLAGGLFLGILAGLFLADREHQASRHRGSLLQIGIVGEKDDQYLNLGIRLIEQMESVSYNCQFQYMDEEEAQEALEQQKVIAVFFLPEGYVDSLIKGTNQPITVRFCSGQSGIASYIARQLAEVADELICDTEAGIYTMKDYYRQHSLPGEKEADISLNRKYIDRILSRSLLFGQKTVNDKEGMEDGLYYLCNGFILLSLFLGLYCSGLWQRDSMALARQLKRQGMSVPQQLAARYAVLLGMELLIYGGLFLALWALCGTGMLELKEWTGEPAAWLLGRLPWCLPVLLLSSGVILLVYECCRDMISGVVVLFLVIGVTGFLSGCFYPITYLPPHIQRLSGFLPPRIMFCYMDRCIQGKGMWKEFGRILCCSGLFFCITVGIRGRYLCEKGL